MRKGAHDALTSLMSVADRNANRMTLDKSFENDAMKTFKHFNQEFVRQHHVAFLDTVIDVNELVDRIRLYLQWFVRSPFLINLASRKVHRHALRVAAVVKKSVAIRETSMKDVLDYWVAEEERLRKILQCKLVAEPWRQGKEMNRYSQLHVDLEEKKMVVKELYFRERKQFLQDEYHHKEEVLALRKHYFILLTSTADKASEKYHLEPQKPDPELVQELSRVWSSLQKTIAKPPEFEFTPRIIDFDKLISVWRELLPTLRFKYAGTVPGAGASGKSGLGPPLAERTPSMDLSLGALDDGESRTGCSSSSIDTASPSSGDIATSSSNCSSNKGKGKSTVTVPNFKNKGPFISSIEPPPPSDEGPAPPYGSEASISGLGSELLLTARVPGAHRRSLSSSPLRMRPETESGFISARGRESSIIQRSPLNSARSVSSTGRPRRLSSLNIAAEPVNRSATVMASMMANKRISQNSKMSFDGLPLEDLREMMKTAASPASRKSIVSLEPLRATSPVSHQHPSLGGTSSLDELIPACPSSPSYPLSQSFPCPNSPTFPLLRNTQSPSPTSPRPTLGRSPSTQQGLTSSSTSSSSSSRPTSGPFTKALKGAGIMSPPLKPTPQISSMHIAGSGVPGAAGGGFGAIFSQLPPASGSSSLSINLMLSSCGILSLETAGSPKLVGMKRLPMGALSFDKRAEAVNLPNVLMVGQGSTTKPS